MMPDSKEKMTMTKKQRVIAAIRKEPVDHVPSCFSLHFPEEMSFGQAAVDAHISFFRETGCDVLKIMNENLVPPIGEMNGPEDWERCRPTQKMPRLCAHNWTW